MIRTLPPEEPSDREILDDLMGKKCRTCGGSKGPRMSHCRSCYFKLPDKMRTALYQRFGRGYENAYRESCKFLGGNNGNRNA
jgi:hypothetical protein